MTESSFPWDGTTVGHAAAGIFVSPYDAPNEFRRFIKSLITYDSDINGFVVIDGNKLKVTEQSPAAAGITIASGWAFVDGFLYNNSAALNLSIAANASGNPRLDIVVLRATTATQLVTAAIVQGTPGATPALPALTQVSGTTFEVPLAYIWVANGFATIVNAEIHDQRIFMANPGSISISDFSQNLIKNSEYIANGSSLTVPPDNWVNIQTGVLDTTKVAKLSGQSRGWGAHHRASGASNYGQRQTVPVLPSTTYAIKVLHKVEAQAGQIVVTTNSASPATITRNARRVNSTITELIYYTTESDATTLTLELSTGAVNGNQITFGQAIVVQGHHPGPYRAFHEVILMDQNIGYGDVNWNVSAKSTGVTDVNFASDYDGIFADALGIYLMATVNDSGSAAGTPTFRISSLPTGTAAIEVDPVSIVLTGVPNDVKRTNAGWVSFYPGGKHVGYRVVATGAGTMDVSVKVAGVIT